MLFSEKVYLWLKQIALVWLPALGALYLGLSNLWPLPNGEAVSGTIMLVDTFLGIILGISTKSYNNSDAKFDGSLKLVDTENGTQLHFGQLDASAVMTKGAVLLKVEDDN